MQLPIDSLSTSKDLVNDLLKLSKLQLLDIWRQLWPGTEKDFCAQFGLTKAAITNSEMVLEAPCPGCQTLITLERHARFDCPNCTKYNSWYIKTNKDLISASITNIKGDGGKIELKPTVKINNYNDISYTLVRYIFIAIKGNIVTNCYTIFCRWLE